MAASAGLPEDLDDVLTTLSRRVEELSRQVAELQGELATARQRISSYEQFDSSLQEAVRSALRAAHEIRQRAATMGRQILDAARDERLALAGEVERLAAERDTLGREVERLRVEVAAAGAAPPAVSAEELRALAAESLGRALDQLVSDLARRTAAPAAPMSLTVPAPPAHPTVVAPPLTPRPEPAPPAAATPTVVAPPITPRPEPAPPVSADDAVTLRVTPLLRFAQLLPIERHLAALAPIESVHMKALGAEEIAFRVRLRSGSSTDDLLRSLRGLGDAFPMALVERTGDVVKLHLAASPPPSVAAPPLH